MEERYPALRHLVGAYFHEDWDHMYDNNIWLVLDDYLRNSGDLAQQLPWEIEPLLARFNDQELRAYLYAEHCCYTAVDFPGGHREWLTEVARRARLGPDDSLLPPPFTDAGRRRYGTFFTDQETGAQVTGAVVRAHRDEIERWLMASGPERFVAESTFPFPVGTAGRHPEGFKEQHLVRAILTKDPDQPQRFRVIHSSPELPRRGRTDLPGLRHLCDAYFYGGWDARRKYPEVVAAFATGAGPHADELLEEIERLRPLSEEELEALLDEFGFQFSLVRDETWHGWLDDLVARIHEARDS